MKFSAVKLKSALLRGAAVGLFVFAAYRAAVGAGIVIDGCDSPVAPRAVLAAHMAAGAAFAVYLAFTCFYLGGSFPLIYGLFLALELTAAFLCRMRVGVYEFLCVAGFPAVYALAAFAPPPPRGMVNDGRAASSAARR